MFDLPHFFQQDVSLSEVAPAAAVAAAAEDSVIVVDGDDDIGAGVALILKLMPARLSGDVRARLERHRDNPARVQVRKKYCF